MPISNLQLCPEKHMRLLFSLYRARQVLSMAIGAKLALLQRIRTRRSCQNQPLVLK